MPATTGSRTRTKRTTTPNGAHEPEAVETTEQFQQRFERDGHLGSVPIEKIDLDVSNHRLRNDEAAIEELAKSIERHGLQQPIVVYEKPADARSNGRTSGSGEQRYTLGFGHRRLEAHKRLGLEAIRAFIKPPAPEAEIRTAQAIENLQRADLNPIEEALAVEALLQSIEQDLERTSDGPELEVEEVAAAMLNRTRGWVRKRATLTRLSPKVRTMLLEGEMLLGHADEIAKLVDHKAQEDVAGRIHMQDGRCHTSVGEIKQAVSREMMSLHGVPWKLDEPVKDLPACETCEHNTDVATALFAEVADKERPQATCLNPRCFNQKAKICTREREKAANKLVKLGVPQTAKQAAEVSADYLKPGGVARLAKKKADPDSARVKPKTASGGRKKADWEIRADANHKLRNAIWKRTDGLHRKILDSIEVTPWTMLGLQLIRDLDEWQLIEDQGWRRTTKKKLAAAKAVVVRHLQSLKSITAADVEALAEKVIKQRGKKKSDQLGRTHFREELVDVACEAFGIETPPKPKLEDFMPKPPEAKPKKTPPAKKKRKRRSGRASGAKKKAGARAPRKKTKAAATRKKRSARKASGGR